MASPITAYRIFIASPGGLADERRAFRDTIDSYNETEAVPRGVLFVPVGWEETLGGVGRPQSIIDEELRTCDYFVLLLHNRWGTPPDSSPAGYTSGTEEEFDIAMECLKDEGAPMQDIVVLFKGVSADQLSDPGEQLRRVLDFKKGLERDRTLLFTNFDVAPRFSELLRRHLGAWLRRHETGHVALWAKFPETETLEEFAVDAAQPKNVPSAVAQATALADNGDWTGAEAVLARAVARGDSAEAVTAYAALLIDDGRLVQAEELLLPLIAERLPQSGNRAAAAYRLLGTIHNRHGDLDKAEIAFREALALDAKSGTTTGIAADFANLGGILRTRGKLSESEEMHRRALDLYTSLGNDRGTARALQALGSLLFVRNDFDRADEMHKKALEVYERLGSESGVAATLASLGHVLLGRGDEKKAEDLYQQAYLIFERLGHMDSMARTLLSIGNRLRARGEYDEAEKALQKSIGLSEKLGRLEGVGRGKLNLGILASRRRDFAAAEGLYKEAIAIAQQIGRPEGVAKAYSNLANLAVEQGKLSDSIDFLEKARLIFKEIEMPAKARETANRINAQRKLESKAIDEVAAAESQPEGLPPSPDERADNST
jgi:tetratricopeptide (TPR) repeat protein